MLNKFLDVKPEVAEALRSARILGNALVKLIRGEAA